MAIRAVGVVSSEVNEKIRGVLSDCIKQWSSQWFIAPIYDLSFKFNDSLFSSVEVAESFKCIHETAGYKLLAEDICVRSSLLQDLFNCDKQTLEQIESELSIDAFQSINDDLVKLIYAKCNVALDGVSAEQVLVSVTLSLNGKSFVINLDSSIFTKMMGSLSAKSTPPIRAISIASVEASVPMKIAIKSEKIAFSQAVSLQVGDVIRLTHEIDEPVPVEVNGQRNYLKSYLVKSLNNKAIIFTES
ncbi:hypothetical protein CWC19_15845 [Pseudoalteromonas aurantia]|uniref:Flagellar motor switch protein FliN-like C-terminal domain-containing protein n=2 Tax=Pseudoalteromonas TaxID=53246 RepID=A0A5S3V5T6_9GAMM|nr:hypothetical protein CWC19_15845 [Pseudoalteromonas aurantia]